MNGNNVIDKSRETLLRNLTSRARLRNWTLGYIEFDIQTRVENGTLSTDEAAKLREEKKDAINQLFKDVQIKRTFEPFLDRAYRRIESQVLGKGKRIGQGDQNAQARIRDSISQLNRSLLGFLNFAASISKRDQTTASLTSMYLGALKQLDIFPSYGELRAFFDFLRDSDIDLRSITGMQHGLGIPKIDELENLLGWISARSITLAHYAKSRIGLGFPKNEDEFIATL